MGDTRHDADDKLAPNHVIIWDADDKLTPNHVIKWNEQLRKRGMDSLLYGIVDMVDFQYGKDTEVVGYVKFNIGIRSCGVTNSSRSNYYDHLSGVQQENRTTDQQQDSKKETD
ncbi:Hypothetical predicted protein [Octopus vulgaris]|uniref:Uncharacterized protein n=1 Tax=Octopus vulgaris TaxID=6645 RepID=A0AA36F8X5_OCTVU|nr:Hypothetical predicted protein [Octopus vulgaris]